MKFCDLHCHSTFSDGRRTPEELVDLAVEAGLSALALTDHNTLGGLTRFFRAAAGRIEVCGGCELDTQADGHKVHLLGLFLDPERSKPLIEAMNAQQQHKDAQCRITIESLAAAGYPLSYDEFTALFPTERRNRMHVARYMMQKGVITAISEAFEGLLRPGNGFYEEPEKLDFYEMIPVIARAGGVSVWAHPLFHVDRDTCEAITAKAVSCGLDGTEVYYCTYSDDDTAFMRDICRRYNLLESGGSDYHGENKPGLMIGTGYGNLRIPYSCYESLKARANNQYIYGGNTYALHNNTCGKESDH